MNERIQRRSELQLHTVMSEDTSVITPYNAVQAAVVMGYKAIAFTDRNSVQSLAGIAYHQFHRGKDLKIIYGAELSNDRGSFTVLAKDRVGLKALYKLISRKEISPEERCHLLIGSSNHWGALYIAAADNAPLEKLREIAADYDYIELYTGRDDDCHREINKRLYELGKTLSIPVAAVGGCHCITAKDAISTEVVESAKKNRLHTSAEELTMRTTEEMLEAFSYLGAEAAYEVVVTNPNSLADRIEQLDPIAEDVSPFLMPNAAERVETLCMEKLESIYGKNPPKEMLDRLTTELSLLGKYASMYLASYEIVNRVRKQGGMTACRGTVGSTMIAYLLGISNANPLPAHYYCPHCKHTEFAQADSGYDLPKKPCPQCGKPMIGDGHNIPYETGISPTGERCPAMDINVPLSLQAEAISVMTELFGKERLAFAGAVSTYMTRLAEQSLQAYSHKTGEEIDDKQRIIQQLSRVKTRDGRHPCGIVILPEGMEWEDITPIRTMDKPVCGIDKVTHMDYYLIDYVLPKINILSYGVLDRLNRLFDITGTKPENVDYNDPAIYDLFFHLDTCGIPEYSSEFCKDVMCEIGPIAFSDLVRVSGMAHGTNTWVENGELLIRENHEFRELISVRDDVFLSLQKYGIDKATAFSAMETARKGKFYFENAKNAEITAVLEQAGVPQWYIQSMKTIRYLFPKAHAVNYAKLALAAAWFKVYYPEAFYNVTLKDLGAEAYLSYDDEELASILETLGDADDFTAPHRHTIALLLEAHSREIPIELR